MKLNEYYNIALGSDSLIGEYLIEGFREGRDQGINGYLVHNVPEYADQYNYIVAKYIPVIAELWFWGAWKDEQPALEAAKDIDGQVIYRNGYYNDHNIANDYPSEETDESLNEGMFDQAFYNTQEIIDNTTGKNKSFISRIAKHQEEKYGNVDIFDASLKYGEVSIGFGDYSLTFFFDNEGNIKDVIGNGQGGKYQSSLEDVAKELYKKFGIENGF